MLGIRRLLLIVAVVLGPAAAALADPSYSAAISHGIVPVAGPVTASPTPVALTASVDTANGSHLEGSVAVDRVLTARVLTAGSDPGIGTSAVGKFDDIVISPLPGQPADPMVQVTLHEKFDALLFQEWSFLDLENGAHLAGIVSQISDFNAAFESGHSIARLGAIVEDDIDKAQLGPSTSGGGELLPGSSPGPVSFEGDSTGLDDPLFGHTISHNLQLDADGFLYLLSRTTTPITTAPGFNPVGAGFLVHDVVRLEGERLLPGLVPVGTPLTLQLNMAVSGSSGTPASVLPQPSGTFDMLHTFGLPRGVPVFDLPEGYTANAPSLGIVDNVRTVPEPSRFLLLGMALVTLLAMRRLVASVEAAR
jgi:hypothetical protein